MPIYVTTGFTRTVMINTTYSSGPPSMNGYQMNATGAPTNPSTGIYTGVASGGILGVKATVSIATVYSNSLFREIMVSDPTPAIPSEPITSLPASPTIVYPAGLPCMVSTNATIKNGLAQTATYSITVYANKTVIGKTTGINVAAGASTTQTFTWNTTSLPYGWYIITAQLSGNTTVSGKKYTFSDSYTGSTVIATLVGDFAGDGTVNATDFVIFLAAYGTKTGQPAYNSACDLNHDGAVNATDFVIFLANYGKRV
jgi:hypothetical protein